VVSLTFSFILEVGVLVLVLRLPCFILVFVLTVSVTDRVGVAAETVPKHIAAKAMAQINFFMIIVFLLLLNNNHEEKSFQLIDFTPQTTN
jgi:hypothetical protein